MDELISREYLINKISSVDGLEGVENSNLFAKHYMDIVKSAPSVTPTRPTARWERLVEDYNKCSKCGEMGKLYRIYKYCPNCGARMETETKNRVGLNFADQDTMMSAT